MVPLSPNTRKRLELLFSPKQQEAACSLLQTDCADNLPFCERMNMFQLERIRIAVLKLSDGNLEQLRRAIDQAKLDWRDTLVAADFGDDPHAHERWMPTKKH